MHTCHLTIGADDRATIVAHDPTHAGHGLVADDLRAGLGLARQHGLSVSYVRSQPVLDPLVVLG